jgi:hypothetical protein
MRQFITDEKGERTGVVLPIGEYEELMERLEDAEALKEADEALAAIERGEEDLLPLDQAVKEMEEERGKLRTSGELKD